MYEYMLLSVMLSLIAELAAREANIDINRIHLIPTESSNFDSVSHGRRSVSDAYRRSNDYDDRSIGIFEQSPSIHQFMPKPPYSTTQKPLKVHQPREDPRFFYQSDSYIKEANGQNVNREVSFIYPGKEVVRAHEANRRTLELRSGDRETNMIDSGSSMCIKCPHDRTLVARPGSDRVLLQAPRLLSCSGHKAPRNVHFVHMYGPKFGSLIDKGTHLVIGRIFKHKQSLQLCKMQIHVVTQGCVTPNYLTSECNGQNCSFACRDPSYMDLHGPSSLVCGGNMKWTGKLPSCKVRTWCKHPSPPEHGHISCRGRPVGSALVEGSKCRVRCAHGWRRHPRAFAVCRRGRWTNTMTCQKIN